jgi:hypothetical protein
MSLFALFNISCFILGIISLRLTPKTRYLLIFLACAGLTFAYFFLDKI